MKSKEEIERKIISLIEEVDELTSDRQKDKDKYGGMSDEQNQDYFYDSAWRMAQINALQWVLEYIK